MTHVKDLDFSSFEKAVATLQEAVGREPANDLERDGVIQRFEYTFELAWKMMRKVLMSLGRVDVSASPKPVIRDAEGEGMVEDVKKWFFFLEARNLSTHIYNQKEAESIYKAAKEFLPYAERLLTKLKGMK